MPSMIGAQWLLEAFVELSTARTYTMGGAAPIPIDKIWMWSDRYDSPDWFTDAIISIDSKMLEIFNGNR